MIHYRLRINVDMGNVPAGTISEWEEVDPAVGIPDFGIGPSEVVMLEATLSSLGQSGAKSMQFGADDEPYVIEYTSNPDDVEEKATP